MLQHPIPEAAVCERKVESLNMRALAGNLPRYGSSAGGLLEQTRVYVPLQRISMVAFS
jgi:hypothetical protein